MLIEALDSVSCYCLCTASLLCLTVVVSMHVSSSVIDVQSCVQRRGKKVLVLDPRVSGFLGLLAEVTLLKEHGVEQ